MARPLLPVFETINGESRMLEHDALKQTDAEIAARVTPVNYAFAPGDIRRYGGSPDAAAATNDAALASMLAVSATHMGRVPAGIYQVTAPQAVPDGAHIRCEKNANFYYTDTISSGSYLFTNGIAGVRGGSLQIDNLSIVLRTGTAKGFKLLNSIDSCFTNYYCEGFIPADWPTSSVAINARTNVGLRIESTAAPPTDCFFNSFEKLRLNHCHTGVSCPSGGISTRQRFTDVSMFGDSIYGDTTSVGFDIGGCQDSIVDGAYMDAYGDAGGGAFSFLGGQATRWRVSKCVFDAEPGAATVGSITLGVTVPMKAISLVSGTGTPTENEILGSFFSAGCSVVDVPADQGNFIESNPNIGQKGTVTLVCLTSGSITLNSGLGGNVYFCEKRGKSIRIWGVLTVASVSAPLGRLQIQGLPFVIANNNSNHAACVIRADGLNATAATALQGYGIRGSTNIEIEHFAAGAAGTTTAADIKAGTEIFFSIDYIAA